MRVFLCAAILLGLCGPVFGASTGESFTAKELVEMAIAKNPELKAMSFDVEAAKASADQTSRWSNPNLDIGAAKKKEREGDTNFSKIGVSQTIEMPGRIGARVKAAEARAEAAKIEQTQSVVETRAQVLNLIYSYKISSEKAAHAKERLERFKTVGIFLKSRVFASPQKRAEAAIVRAKLMVLIKELRHLEAKQKIAWNNLNLYLGLKSEPNIKVEWYKTAPVIQLSELTAKLENNNPALLRQNQKINEAQSDLELARKDIFPSLSISGSYENGTGANPEKVYGLGLSMPIPVFDAKGSSIQSQRRILDAENERRKWVAATVDQELKSALEHYNAAQASLSDLRMSEVAKLEHDMVAIDQGFKKGQVDLLTYIEADAEHFEGLNAILDSQLEFVEAQNSLFMLVGQAPRILE